MSHHYPGPNYGFPNGDARLNLTDLYLFPKPGDPRKSILIMNAHPSISITTLEPTTAEPFAPEAAYEFRIDTNGDAVADITYQIRFSPSKEGGQTAIVRRMGRPSSGDDGQVVVEGAPVSMGRETRVTEAGDHRLFAGWRSDSFFADPQGALNGLQFAGYDFFSDKDVCSIVLEVPNSALGSKPVRVWARALVSVPGADGGWSQADRCARPSQGPFLAGDVKEAYLAGEPADDARFVAVFAHSLEHAGGYSPSDATRVAASLLPDLMSYDPTRPASFPANGRALTDDVFDYFIAILSNGKVKDDKVGPHRDLVAEFPYLAPPHGERDAMKPTTTGFNAGSTGRSLASEVQMEDAVRVVQADAGEVKDDRRGAEKHRDDRQA